MTLADVPQPTDLNITSYAMYALAQSLLFVNVLSTYIHDFSF